jgi:hypothetical protein
MIRRLLLLALALLTIAGPVCAPQWCQTTCRRDGDTIVCETFCDKSI